MCGCSGTSVKMSSRFMFNVKNNRSIARRTTISHFRTAVPRSSSQPFYSKRSSNGKKSGFRSFYFSY